MIRVEPSDTKPTICVGVFTCERDREWWAACEDTWLAQVPAIMEVVKVDANFMPSCIPDTYENLAHKTRAFARYVRERGFSNALKVDNDSYVRPDLFEVPECEYAGRKSSGLTGNESDLQVPAGAAAEYCSGGAYWLAGRAIEIIASSDVTDWAEDRWVGTKLLAWGIRPRYLPNWVAPYDENNVLITPVSRFLRNPNAAVVMQMQSPRQMRDAHAGKFD